MRIVVDVSHPAHIHYFKHFIWEMQKRGHTFLITASEKDVLFRLLDAYGFRYINLGTYGDSLVKKAINIPLMDLKMYYSIRKFKPDICIGAGSIRASHAAALLKIPSILLESTEHSQEQHMLYLPFVSTILTPSSFDKDLGKKQVRYNSCKELLYLHPNRFIPNQSVLTELGLTQDDSFIIVRFVSWNASHDVGQHGILDRSELIKTLKKYGRVFITSESELPLEFQPYKIMIPPEKLHDLLYYATLYIGEGATMAAEAAILGTPSIFISSLAKKIGSLTMLEEQYGLIYNSNDQNDAIKKAIDLLSELSTKESWKNKQLLLLENKLDLTAYLIWLIENYPHSLMQLEKGSNFIVHHKIAS